MTDLIIAVLHGEIIHKITCQLGSIKVLPDNILSYVPYGQSEDVTLNCSKFSCTHFGAGQHILGDGTYQKDVAPATMPHELGETFASHNTESDASNPPGSPSQETGQGVNGL